MDERQILGALNRLSRHRDVGIEILKAMPNVFPQYATKLVTAKFNEAGGFLTIETIGSKFVGRVVVVGKQENDRTVSDVSLVLYHLAGELETEVLRLPVTTDGEIKNPNQIAGEYFAAKSFLEKICLGFELGR